jgi:hypothetical protein
MNTETQSLSIGEQIASAYMPFMFSKHTASRDELFNGLSRDINRGYERRANSEAKMLKNALIAIVARINGEFDNPQLMEYGELCENPLDDIMAIADSTLGSAD